MLPAVVSNVSFVELWYATNFMIQHLSKEEIHTGYYNAAVEAALQKQIGHKDIKTTYLHYIKQASLILAVESGSLDYTLGLDYHMINNLLD